jgi:hypothetical protein
MADAANEAQFVALEAHARTAPVPEASPREFVTDLCLGNRETGR